MYTSGRIITKKRGKAVRRTGKPTPHTLSGSQRKMKEAIQSLLTLRSDYAALLATVAASDDAALAVEMRGKLAMIDKKLAKARALLPEGTC